MITAINKIYDLEEHVSSEFDKVSRYLAERKEAIVKPKRRVRLELPLRSTAGRSVFYYLMSLEKPKQIHVYCWSRSRITLVILRYLGLRLNETSRITKRILQNALSRGYTAPPKKNEAFVIALTEGGKQALNAIWSTDVLTVFGVN